jgi:CRP-like cAMP-binding protein
VAVSIDGHRVREEGPGESFGEIALLRNVPRTATVEAMEPTQLVSLDRGTFLEAVTGQPASVEVAEATVARHLDAAPPEPAPAEEAADARA